jgi:hypothetical protein
MTKLTFIAGCPGAGKSRYISDNQIGREKSKDEFEMSNINTIHHFSQIRKNRPLLGESENDQIWHIDLLAFCTLRLYWWPLYLSINFLTKNMKNKRNRKMFQQFTEIEGILIWNPYDQVNFQYNKRENGKKDKFLINRRKLLYSRYKFIRRIFFVERVYQNLNLAFIASMLETMPKVNHKNFTILSTPFEYSI